MADMLEQLQSDIQFLHSGAFDQVSPASLVVIARFLAKEKEYALLARLRNAFCEITGEQLALEDRAKSNKDISSKKFNGLNILRKVVLSVVTDHIANVSKFDNDGLSLSGSDNDLSFYFEDQFDAVSVYSEFRPRTYKTDIRKMLHSELSKDVCIAYLNLESLLESFSPSKRQEFFCKEKIVEALDRSEIPGADVPRVSDEDVPSVSAVMMGGARRRPALLC